MCTQHAIHVQYYIGRATVHGCTVASWTDEIVGIQYQARKPTRPQQQETGFSSNFKLGVLATL